jgi:sigma-B regulation protein RsbU (phosphoserine phosphatase)
MELRLRPAHSAAPDLMAMIGRSGKALALGLLLCGIAYTLGAPDWLQALLGAVTFVAGLIVAWKMLRAGARQMIWRLRNRLIVAYVFMALIPVLLLLALGAALAYLTSSQMLAYLVTTNLEHRVEELQKAVDTVMKAPPANRRDAMNRLGDYYSGAYEGFTLHYQAGNIEARFPAATEVPAPPAPWPSIRGLVARDGGYFLWARVVRDNASLTATVPVTNELLDGLSTGLGVVELLPDVEVESDGNSIKIHRGKTKNRAPSGPRAGRMLPATSLTDPAVYTVAFTQYSNWTEPGVAQSVGLAAAAPFSAVLGALYNPGLAQTNVLVGVLTRILIVLFVIVELIALVIGISLTRSITGAVHDLYQGTDRVMEGDLTHRIRIRGRDQIASLSLSFNRMTENIERLLQVAAEKERLQADVEIAREVQAQMYPKAVPESSSLRLAAACLPARTVSGDFYHYQRLSDHRIAFLMGDVSGKGISAALLMATIQTSCRARLDRPLEGPSHMVAELNRQMCQHSAPEKYATLCFAIYDESTRELAYTNAAHLPPILVRNGNVARFSVDGTIVGSFPRVTYGESRVVLEPGDLLVCFTDGVTEPENEYGEQFGEDRLIELVQRHAGSSELDLIQAVSNAVRQWTGSPELQDDLTMLIARTT